MVKAFNIPFFAHSQGAPAVDFNKIIYRYQGTYPLTVFADRGDEGSQYDNSRLQEKLDHFADAADIFSSVLWRKSKIPAESMSNIVPIQHKGMTT